MGNYLAIVVSITEKSKAAECQAHPLFVYNHHLLLSRTQDELPLKHMDQGAQLRGSLMFG